VRGCDLLSSFRSFRVDQVGRERTGAHLEMVLMWYEVVDEGRGEAREAGNRGSQARRQGSVHDLGRAREFSDQLERQSAKQVEWERGKRK